jgi:chromosome segregation ATPase
VDGELSSYKQKVEGIVAERRDALNEVERKIDSLAKKLEVAVKRRQSAFGKAQELLTLASVEREVRVQLTELKSRANTLKLELERAEIRLADVSRELESDN